MVKQSGALGSARILIRLVWGTIVRLQIVHGAIAYLSELFLSSHACVCIPHRHVRGDISAATRKKHRLGDSYSIFSGGMDDLCVWDTLVCC